MHRIFHGIEWDSPGVHQSLHEGIGGGGGGGGGEGGEGKDGG